MSSFQFQATPPNSESVLAPMHMQSQNEAELIRRILAGETNLFHDLIRPYERMVYVTILAILRNESEAEDGAQETMIKAYRHLRGFRGDSKFSTWLVSIAMNEARRRLRKLASAHLDSLDQLDSSGENALSPAVLTDWRVVPLEMLQQQELRHKLREAVNELPEIYREIFVLRDVEGLNQEEAAAAAGVQVTLVKVRLHRARIMLQKKLAPYLAASLPARKGFFGRLFR